MFCSTRIAHAQTVVCDYPEAPVWATRSLALRPTFDPTTLWMLTAANAHLGRMGEAHRFLDELERLALGVTIASIRAGQPANPSRIAAILDGRPLAGLKER